MTGFSVKVTVYNPNQNTIWNKLAAKLGREPTEDECRDEFKRIIQSKDVTNEND